MCTWAFGKGKKGRRCVRGVSRYFKIIRHEITRNCVLIQENNEKGVYRVDRSMAETVSA
jgi:hypothetical protein